MRDTNPLILCVEDEPELLADLCDELAEAGYDVIAARHGADALARSRDRSPDLVLCDITMPEMDGFELMSRFKTDPEQYGHVPFIFLTAMAERDDIVRGKRQGADDYLVKPVDYDLMLATVDARLRQVQTIRKSAPAPAAPTLPAEAVLDLIARPILLIAADGRIAFANKAAEPFAGTAEAPKPQFSPGRLRALLCRSPSAPVARMSNSDWPDLVICRLEEGSDVCAAVFLAPPVQDDNSTRIQHVAELFQFTVTESRIALKLCNGLTPAQISDELGIAPTTTAFHLKNLYQKTGAGRQSSLVAMLLSHPAALV